jgi:hypothetical protein
MENHMKRKFLLASAVAAMTFGVASSVDAGGPPAGAGDGGKPVGIECMQHGLGLLRSLGSPAQVSRDVLGLPLNAVLALHRDNPQGAAGVLESYGLPAGPCDLDG